MPTFDEMVVKFLFDTTDLEKGAKEATAATAQVSKQLTDTAGQGEKAQTGALSSIVKGWNAMAAANRKAADAAVQNSKAMATATETVVQSGEKALRTFGALFLLFAGARSVKDFVTDMIGVDAALGRTAKNIGQTPEALSGIGRAVERMGGSFNGAVGGLKGLSDAFEQMRTTGNSAINEPLARLQGLSGRAIKFGKDVHENFLSIADALHAEQAKDPAMADYLGRQILGDEGLTNLAKKGRAGVLAEEAKSPKITRQQTEDAQKLQEQLAAVRQGFQDIGNAILMSFGPSMIRAAEWVKDLVEKNRGLIETKVAEWARDVGTWFQTHKTDIENFGKAVGDLAAVAGTLATAFASQSPMMQALEAFAVLMGGRVLGAIGLVRGAMTALGAVPVPAWALAALGLSAAAQWQGAKDTAKVLGSDDPTKNDVVVDPESGMATKVGEGEGNQGTGPNTGFNRATGFLPWFKGLFGSKEGQANPTPVTDGNALRRGDEVPAKAQAGGFWASLKRLVGFGDDAKVKDGIEDTAKATGEMRDLMKAQKDGVGGEAGGGGPGGTLGAAQRFLGQAKAAAGAGYTPAGGGGNTPAKGALAANQKEAYAAALKEGLSPTAARALVANMSGESLANPRDNHWDGTHMSQGIVQWDPTRTARIKAQFGKEPKDMSVAEQTKAAIWEMNSRPEYAATARALKGDNAADMIGALVDNYERPRDRAKAKAQRMGYYRGFNPASASAAPAPAATASAAPSGHVGDQAALDAQNRIIAGKGTPADRAIIAKHREQENVPPVKSAPVTVDHLVRHLLSTIHKAQRLTQHGDKPVAVTYVDKNGVAPSGNPLADLHRWRFDGAMRKAHEHAASLNHMTRMAASGSYSHAVHNTSNSDTRIGSITVQTAATDARGIAADIEPHLHRGQAAGRADYGLA